MYFVYCDSEKIYDIRDDSLLLTNPILELEDNASGSFSFDINDSNIFFDKIKPMLSKIEVFQDKEKIFEGRPIEFRENFNRTMTYRCEGALAYLCDSVQPQAEFHDTSVQDFLKALLKVHNDKMPKEKQIKLGRVTVEANLYRFTNMELTLEAIKEKLVKNLGGHIIIRYEGKERYLDYLKEGEENETQTISFGKNLLNFTKNLDVTKIVTRLIPLGVNLPSPKIPALGERLGISGATEGGVPYVENKEAIEKYGIIERTNVWNDVSIVTNLKRKGEEWLKESQFENVVIEISAIDLSILNPEIKPLRMLDKIRAISKPHGMDAVFPVSKLSIPLDKPDGRTVTLGNNTATTMTESVGNQMSSESSGSGSGADKHFTSDGQLQMLGRQIRNARFRWVAPEYQWQGGARMVLHSGVPSLVNIAIPNVWLQGQVVSNKFNVKVGDIQNPDSEEEIAQKRATAILSFFEGVLVNIDYKYYDESVDAKNPFDGFERKGWYSNYVGHPYSARYMSLYDSAIACYPPYFGDDPETPISQKENIVCDQNEPRPSGYDFPKDVNIEFLHPKVAHSTYSEFVAGRKK